MGETDTNTRTLAEELSMALEADAAFSAEETTKDDEAEEESETDSLTGEDAEPAPVAAAAENAKISDPSTVEEKVEAGAEPPIETPNFWSAEAKSIFPKLPREAQKILAAQEEKSRKDYAQKFEDVAKKGRRYEALDSVFEPIRDELYLNGFDEVSYVRNLMTADKFLRANPLEAIIHLAQDNGIDLRQLTQPTQQNVSPEFQAVQRELAAVKTWQARQQQAQQAQMFSGINQEVANFVQEADEKGSARYPHLEAVGPEMVRLVTVLSQTSPQSSPREILQKAYRIAVSENPEVMALEERARAEEAERQKIAEAKKKAAQAKKAGSSIKGAPSTGLTREPPKSIRGAIEAAMEASV